jgi:hypothetical protein
MQFNHWKIDRLANIPHTFSDIRSVHVIARFFLRMIVLCAFAALGGNGFGRTLAALLLLSTIFCVVTGALRREKPFTPVLTHWDEAATYGLLYGLISTIAQVSIT